jgi:hypothetical protein
MESVARRVCSTVLAAVAARVLISVPDRSRTYTLYPWLGQGMPGSNVKDAEKAQRVAGSARSN